MPLHSRYIDVVLPEVSFPDYIFAGLRRGGNRTAIIEAATGRQWTFSEIAGDAIRCASALHRRGLRKGDILAACCMNCAEFPIIVLAAAACGATVTSCNPRYTVDELKHQLNDSQAKIVFATASESEKIKHVASSVISIQKIYSIGEADGVESYARLVSGENGAAFPNHVQFDVKEDVLLLLYSSGTTGSPKGVMLTHLNFVSELAMGKLTPRFKSDSEYSATPLFHMYGLLRLFRFFDQGLCHVLDVRFDLDSLFSSIEKYKISRFGGVPPMLLSMVKSPLSEKYDLSSLKDVRCSAAPVPVGVAEDLKKKFRCTFAQAYGMTEVTGIIVGNPRAPTSSVGLLAPNTKLKVIDIATGKELGPNESGELCFKGPQVTKGYFKNATATRNTIDVDGWLHTGDIGYYDDNEFIYVIDRLKELIKYKGFQVAPSELEDILVSHPKVADAAVIGVPDYEAGELPKAFVVPSDKSLTKQELHDFISGKVSKYKYLNGGIEFRSAIMKTPTGKILRRFYKQQVAGKAKL